MPPLRWSYSSFLLIRIHTGSRSFVLPIALSLVEDLCEALGLLGSLVLYFAPSAVRARGPWKKLYRYMSPRKVRELVWFPKDSIQQLRRMGPFVLMRIRDEGRVQVEIRIL